MEIGRIGATGGNAVVGAVIEHTVEQGLVQTHLPPMGADIAKA